jgi:hypothetical protein
LVRWASLAPCSFLRFPPIHASIVFRWRGVAMAGIRVASPVLDQ